VGGLAAALQAISSPRAVQEESDGKAIQLSAGPLVPVAGAVGAKLDTPTSMPEVAVAVAVAGSPGPGSRPGTGSSFAGEHINAMHWVDPIHRAATDAPTCDGKHRYHGDAVQAAIHTNVRQLLSAHSQDFCTGARASDASSTAGDPSVRSSCSAADMAEWVRLPVGGEENDCRTPGDEDPGDWIAVETVAAAGLWEAAVGIWPGPATGPGPGTRSEGADEEDDDDGTPNESG